MASHVFTLQLPSDPRYRPLVPDVATRFIEIVGGTSAEGAALSTAVSAAVDRLVVADAEVELVFHASPSGVEATVRCGGRSSVVTHPFPARQA